MTKRTNDWLPRNHEQLYNKATQTVNYFTGTVLARIGIAGSALTWYQDEFIGKYGRFKTAFMDWFDPAGRTPIKTTVLEETENVFKPVYRRLYTGYVKDNPLVMDDDLQGAGFPKRHAGGRKPPKTPVSLIEIITDTSIPARVIFSFRNAGSRGFAKPAGVHGAEFVYIVRAAGAPPPKDWSELTHSVFDTRTPLTLDFTGEQRGMILYFAARWENTQGEKGPWNDIQWVYIP